MKTTSTMFNPLVIPAVGYPIRRVCQERNYPNNLKPFYSSRYRDIWGE